MQPNLNSKYTLSLAYPSANTQTQVTNAKIKKKNDYDNKNTLPTTTSMTL